MGAWPLNMKDRVNRIEISVSREAGSDRTVFEIHNRGAGSTRFDLHDLEELEDMQFLVKRAIDQLEHK